VLSSVAASLVAISRMQRRSLSDRGDLPPGDLPDRTYEIEAELGRAREELSFFRELHEGGASEKPQTSDS
jgi:hypothetical protein